MGKKDRAPKNPTDVFRKKQRQKELKKNKETRKKVREVSLLKKNPDDIRQQIQKLEQLDTDGKMDKSLKVKKKHLEETMQKVIQKKQELQPIQNLQFPIMSSSTSFDQQNLLQRYPNPEQSVYYHPTLNPYGAPPPGAPMLYRPVPIGFPNPTPISAPTSESATATVDATSVPTTTTAPGTTTSTETIQTTSTSSASGDQSDSTAKETNATPGSSTGNGESDQTPGDQTSTLPATSAETTLPPSITPPLQAQAPVPDHPSVVAPAPAHIPVQPPPGLLPFPPGPGIPAILPYLPYPPPPMFNPQVHGRMLFPPGVPYPPPFMPVQARAPPPRGFYPGARNYAISPQVDPMIAPYSTPVNQPVPTPFMPSVESHKTPSFDSYQSYPEPDQIPDSQITQTVTSTYTYEEQTSKSPSSPPSSSGLASLVSYSDDEEETNENVTPYSQPSATTAANSFVYQSQLHPSSAYQQPPRQPSDTPVTAPYPPTAPEQEEEGLPSLIVPTSVRVKRTQAQTGPKPKKPTTIAAISAKTQATQAQEKDEAYDLFMKDMKTLGVV